MEEADQTTTGGNKEAVWPDDTEKQYSADEGDHAQSRKKRKKEKASRILESLEGQPTTQLKQYIQENKCPLGIKRRIEIILKKRKLDKKTKSSKKNRRKDVGIISLL